MNTLEKGLITVMGRAGRFGLMTLPGVLAALAYDEVTGFPALRAHQRHAWHSFLVLLAAIALHRADLTKPPETEAEWRALLQRLTPDYPGDEPWTLVTPIDQPALLQPPIPSGNLAELKNRIATPDGLDMLVTAKNHDLKQAVMIEAAAEDWLFALVTLQTMEGFLGAGNYGISRMNGGFANRAAVSLAPPGGPAAQWRRDLQQILALRGKLGGMDYAPRGGLALLWLAPWDGTGPLRQDALDEYYIEICRRVRLCSERGRLVAHAGSSKAPRVVPTPGGVTGDPWSPVVVEKDGTIKSLTVNGSGLGYRRIVECMFNVTKAPLQRDSADDATEGLHILARALVRGQGKTEGYHERRIPLSRKRRFGLREIATDKAAQAAHDRVELAGLVQNQVLRWALLSLFQNGPDKIDPRDKDSQRKAELFLKRFDVAVDRDFFPDLWIEMDEDDADKRDQLRGVWVRKLRALAERLLEQAEHEAARSSRRHFRAVVRAQDRLSSAARFNDKISPYLSKGSAA
jgi:CRISPR system Cascade subunit CasA